MEFRDLPGNSKVWIYPFKEKISEDVKSKFELELNDFIFNWKSHGKPVKAGFEIYKNSMLIIAADEDFESPSGCSIDACVHKITEIAEAHNLNVFNRLGIYILNQEDLHVLSRTQLEEEVNSGNLNANSETINTQITKLEDWNTRKIQLLGAHWFGKKLFQEQLH